MAKKVSFDKAFEELQAIISKLQNDDASIDTLSEQLKKAKSLVDVCKSKLREVEADIESIQFNDEE